MSADQYQNLIPIFMGVGTSAEGIVLKCGIYGKDGNLLASSDLDVQPSQVMFIATHVDNYEEHKPSEFHGEGCTIGDLKFAFVKSVDDVIVFKQKCADPEKHFLVTKTSVNEVLIAIVKSGDENKDKGITQIHIMAKELEKMKK